MDGFNDYLNIR